MSLLRKSLTYARQNGVGTAVKEIYNRFNTAYYERRFSISTGQDETEESPRSEGKVEFKGYEAIGYRHIFGSFARIPFDASQVVFLDYGAGKGRVLAAAASRPFKRVLGVEYSARLTDIGRKNIAG